MARRKRRAAKKRKVEWSKVVCLLAMLAGLLIVQECLFLMYLCIKSGYTAAAAWLTAATGVGEAIIIAGANGYLSLAKSDHKRGGITFEAAKANNFRTTRRTMAALTAPPSEYRPHNESPLAGFHRPVEGAFSVFRRFRVYGGVGAFFAFGWASTLPRRKGGVATHLRRREGLFIRPPSSLVCRMHRNDLQRPTIRELDRRSICSPTPPMLRSSNSRIVPLARHRRQGDCQSRFSAQP